MNLSRKNSILLIGAFLVLCFDSDAQDIHFSQFYAAPQYLNPGLSGLFNGNYRFTANYRNQWQSVSIPYRTFGFGAEAKGIYKGINAGLNVITDKTGDSKLTTTIVNPTISYPLKLTSDSSQTIWLGIQPGFTQKTIDYSALSFDNQYNGRQYDGNRANGEEFSTNQLSNFSLAAGVVWEHIIDQKENKKLQIGLSLNNLTNAKESLAAIKESILDKRYVLFSSYQIPLDKKWMINPMISINGQGKYKNIIAGGNAHYRLNRSEQLIGGIWTRNKDAFWLNAGYQKNLLRLIVSYDFNFSDLSVASKGRGGLEFSLQYIISIYNPKIRRYIQCPNYM